LIPRGETREALGRTWFATDEHLVDSVARALVALKREATNG